MRAITPLGRAIAAVVHRIRARREAASAAAIDAAVRDGESAGNTQVAAYAAVMQHSAGPH